MLPFKEMSSALLVPVLNVLNTIYLSFSTIQTRPLFLNLL